MDPLDDAELKAFEHLGCIHCAQWARRYLAGEIDSGVISPDDLADLEVVVIDD